MSPFLRRVALLIPYLAVGLGLFVAHNAWAALLGYHAGMALLLSLAEAWPQARQLWAPVQARWIVPMVIAGILSGVGLYVLWPFLYIAPNLGALLALLGLNSASWPAFILYFSLGNT